MVWDRETGLPLHNAIVWLDNRTSDICRATVQQLGSKDYFRPGRVYRELAKCFEMACQPCAAALAWLPACSHCKCCPAAAAVAAPISSACREPSHTHTRRPSPAAVTGLPVSTYFSAYKLKWLLGHSRAVADAAAAGRCMFGTVDSWLIYQLTGGCWRTVGVG